MRRRRRKRERASELALMQELRPGADLEDDGWFEHALELRGADRHVHAPVELLQAGKRLPLPEGTHAQRCMQEGRQADVQAEASQVQDSVVGKLSNDHIG